MLLLRRYATYFVQGFERAPEDAEHIQASACCKHYVYAPLLLPVASALLSLSSC